MSWAQADETRVKSRNRNKEKEYIVLVQLQIRDALKAVRIKATKAYKQYVEEPKTSQRRGRFDMEMELFSEDRWRSKMDVYSFSGTGDMLGPLSSLT